MDAILEPLLHSPRLPEYVSLLSAVLRDEAERRQKFYEEMTEEHKWEFIDGEVIMHSPAKNRHLVTVMNITVLLQQHARLHDLGAVRTEKCLVKFPRNDYEPDVVYFTAEQAAAFTSSTMLFPPPALVVEVLSDSTAKFDRGVKFTDYEAHVPEYWIVDPEEEVVEQYVQRDGAYHLKFKASSGSITSEVVIGFSVPVRALFEEAENLKALRGLMDNCA